MDRVRENHKDVSWLVNPLNVVLNDGRTFEFQTSVKDDMYIVRVFNKGTGLEYQSLQATFKHSEQVNNYIDDLLTDKTLHKQK